nr:hypothetical protein [Tanacetum cinerariifolium]
MFLTRLFEHVRISHPYVITDVHYLVDHVMIPLSEKQVFRIMPKGKIPHPQTPTPTESSELPSPTPHQEEEENDPVNNYMLDLIIYIDQLPAIEGGKSSEFKQTKGMFKCFGHFLSNLGKKNQAIPTQGINVSPLAPRALVFSTSTSSPLDLHLYLTSLEDIPPRISNPPPSSSSIGFSQTPLQQTPMDFEPSFPPINLSRSRISAQPEPFLSRVQVVQELSQYQDLTITLKPQSQTHKMCKIASFLHSPPLLLKCHPYQHHSTTQPLLQPQHHLLEHHFHHQAPLSFLINPYGWKVLLFHNHKNTHVSIVNAQKQLSTIFKMR